MVGIVMYGVALHAEYPGMYGNLVCGVVLYVEYPDA